LEKKFLNRGVTDVEIEEIKKTSSDVLAAKFFMEEESFGKIA